MLHEDIRAVVMHLGELASRLKDEDWEIVRNAKNNLAALADGVEVMESSFPVPKLEECAASSARGGE